jgi:argininosuccinate lyase
MHREKKMAKKLWGGRFDKETDPLVEEFTRSIQYDYKLAKYDLVGSICHVNLLKKSGYLSGSEAQKLTKALHDIEKNISKTGFTQKSLDEDIHTYVQNELYKKVGELALKLQTARSRNDQVAFATKIYCVMEMTKVQVHIAKLKTVLSELAHNNADIIIPGFTHFQHAQPVYLKDYLNAYVQMLSRDNSKLCFIVENFDLTMGSGALAGTPIDSAQYNTKIKVLDALSKNEDIEEEFTITATENSLDTISDRDFVIEIISVLSLVAMHLSRLAEDLIIWSTKEFDFVEIDEAFCTGSSLMPQKKNPDVLELIRGYAGRLYGNLVSVLTMMKGLPLTYNRDMQLDKEPLFNSLEIVSSELKVLAGLIETLKFNKAKIKEHLEDEGLYATDIVYYLVDKKVPFKDAHTIVGKLVKYSIDNELQIKDMPENLLKKFSK